MMTQRKPALFPPIICEKSCLLRLVLLMAWDDSTLAACIRNEAMLSSPGSQYYLTIRFKMP